MGAPDSTTSSSSAHLVEALQRLRDALGRVRLPLDLDGASDQRRACSELTHQLDDYVIPRLVAIDAPLLAVVGGSTGAGKSTLVNSLIGRVVSKPGVIRPTTRAPVLVHHPDDAAWFDDDRLLPGLIRSRASSADQRSLHLVAEPTLPRGLAILDAPDIDSVVAANRDLAVQLLEAADLWLFTTSAARYADAVPWNLLHHAASRQAAVAVVLNRVPPAGMQKIPAHLGRLMSERGLANAPLFAVPETLTDADGILPGRAVAPIRSWLATLAADQTARQRVVLQTLVGAIGSVARRSLDVAVAVDAHTEAIEQLRHDATAPFQEAARQVHVQSADGTLLRGEILARWHDYVGTGEVMRTLDRKVGTLRDRLLGAIKGQPSAPKEVGLAVGAGLEALLREQASAAVEHAEDAWRASPAGRDVLARTSMDLSQPSHQLPGEVARAIREWQGDVMDLVAGEGMGKRSKARFFALGVNGVAAALMLVVFAQTGGLTGAEVGIAGGASVVAQRILEAVFGDDAIRRLADKARSSLDARCAGIMAGELSRFETALDGVGVDEQVAGELREAALQVATWRDDAASRATLDETSPHEAPGDGPVGHTAGPTEATHALAPGETRALDGPPARELPTQTQPASVEAAQKEDIP